MTEEYRQKLIVALDVKDYDEAAKLVEALSPHVGLFKVGLELFVAEGPAFLQFSMAFLFSSIQGFVLLLTPSKDI